MRFDDCHWSQENTSGLCGSCFCRDDHVHLNTDSHCRMCAFWVCVKCVCERMLGCYCTEGLADFRATLLSVRLCIGGLYCGSERPDVERVLQRNNKVFVATAPMPLLSSIALLMPFQSLQEGGGLGLPVPASGCVCVSRKYMQVCSEVCNHTQEWDVFIDVLQRVSVAECCLSGSINECLTLSPLEKEEQLPVMDHQQWEFW